MFARSAFKFGKPAVQTGRRNMSVPTFLYNNVWEKSTAKYIAYVVVTLVIADFGYHKFFDVLWDANNKGVSWLQFLFGVNIYICKVNCFIILIFFVYFIYRNNIRILIGLNSMLQKRMMMMNKLFLSIDCRSTHVHRMSFHSN